MRWIGAAVFALLSVGLAAGEPDPNTDLALEPEKAVIDFKLQGEYLGEAGGTKQGAQIIALGGGTFRAVLIAGGLPGSDCDGQKRVELDGKLDRDKAVFSTPGGKTFTATGDSFSGQTEKGDKYELKKVLRESPAAGAKPPEGAIVLFDGTNADAWHNGRMDDRKLLHCGVKSKQNFQSFKLHMEFRLPFKPYGRGQDRGNSGVYLQDRYECQVLDSFGLKGAHNECGGIYSKMHPRVNMCFPPLSWQTYDIDFTAAEFGADGKKTKDATVTVKHNGVLIHENFAVNGPTGGGQPESAQPGQLQFQDHGNPVFYRNIWIVEKK